LLKRIWSGYGLIALFVNVNSANAMESAPLHILALGDSLTAGFNLPAGDAFPVRLEAALRAKGYAVRISNAGVSGDTTAGGKARLDWILADHPDAAIVELGANDALRGIDPAVTFANLDTILECLKAHGVTKILLAGMMAPRNYGPDYAHAFDSIYPRLAEKWKIPLYPFFLDGVALHPEMTQSDGLHPNAQGVARIVAGILPAVETLIGTSIPAPPTAKRTP
jgi:acyl-CoA thioesterase-1